MHTTANAANTTDDCLQILTSDFNSSSAEKFIGTQHLNITDSQYQTIRAFTLDLTEKYSSTKDKITAIYQWAKDTSLKASVGKMPLRIWRIMILIKYLKKNRSMSGQGKLM